MKKKKRVVLKSCLYYCNILKFGVRAVALFSPNSSKEFIHLSMKQTNKWNKKQ